LKINFFVLRGSGLPFGVFRILVISHTNTFICIYSNFSPKIGCHGNALLSLVYGSVTDELIPQ